MTSQPTISFEFFPPKNEDTAAQLWEAVPELAALGPKYMTVTYGAGGSTKAGTMETLIRAVKDYPNIPFASHLTFLSTAKGDLDNYIAALWDEGVKAIVALRGDLPKGTSYDDFKGDNYYQHTAEFVRILKEKHPFEIIVGAYPEKHPDAPSLDADIAHLKLKCEAGADRATTQFFFDNDVYYKFVEQCRKAGITTPINPGLIPIHDFESLKRFSARCGASIPGWLHEKFEGLENNPEEARKIATDLLILQSEDLVAQGIDHIHYYALNKASITLEACEALGYREKAA
ncbi:MAG: methylenetetrahydrofolate reductase [Alphaproteobacteria bacterium]|nr:methylenetetrahydrofolate reductase [Alphaproteobacteria bacterium]